MWASICSPALGHAEFRGKSVVHYGQFKYIYIYIYTYIYIFPKQSSDYVTTYLKAFDDDYCCVPGRKWLCLFIILCQRELAIRWDLPFIRKRVKSGLSWQGSSLLLRAHWGS